ncbi:MAG: hypothetical protein ACYC61_22280 [Isosphaeraceae bacterium]
MDLDHTSDRPDAERGALAYGRFYVRAPSVNAVRRALHRAPGGVRVVGREDRETILCTHTMDEHSLTRHWPIILSRLAKAGLALRESR